MAEADVVLELDRVTKRFGEVVAVDAASFKVARGEFVTLLGPSGCGKTSTLRIIAGFLTPDAGVLSLRGRVVNDVPPYERDIGVVFQSYALFPHMTVAQNVGFGLRMRRAAKDEAARQVREALALVQLTGLEDRFPNQLSGGQQQRVAIARALAIAPSILLMDEPMSNLDALLRAEMQLELRQIVERAGVTTINVTHNQEEAMAMSDRVIVMSRGRIEQMGAPIEVYHRPRNEFVANFLGRSNLMSCRIAARDGQRASATTAAGQSLSLVGIDAAVGETVTIQVRPETIELTGPGGDGTNAFAGRVLQRAFMGASFEYIVDVAGQRFLVRVLGAGGNPAFAAGDAVTVRWRPEHAVGVGSPAAADRSGQ